MGGKGTDGVSRRWRATALLAIGIAIGTTMTATPVYSHVGGTVAHLWTKHIRPKTDARYYTKAQSEARYVNVGEKATSAAQADFAATANTANTATSATSATSATNATSATSATNATNATNADKLDGKDANQIGVNGRQTDLGASPSNSTSPKEAQATCPAGEVVVGTGFDIGGGKDGISPDVFSNVVVDAVLITTTTVTVSAYEADATSASWFVEAYAICATAP